MKALLALLVAASIIASVFVVFPRWNRSDGQFAAGPNSGPASAAAALALAEGLDLARGPDYSPARASDDTERELLAKLQSGDDAAALEAVRALAARGAESLELLQEIMNDEGWSDEVRSAAAQALLEEGTEDQAAAAIAALGQLAGGKNTQLLGDVLLDESWPDRLRLEAAYALGEVKSPLAADLLFEGYRAANDDLFRQEELVGIMGTFPFPAVREEFGRLLNEPQPYPDIRAAAAEALGESSGEALPFLVEIAAKDYDSSVREMAAWAAYYHSGTGQLGPQLAEMALDEPEADVRRRMYEGQIFQEKNEAARLLSLVRSETDKQARVAGWLAIADSVGRGTAGEEAAGVFREEAVPELERTATEPNALNVQLRAVMALQKAQSPQAVEALARIASSSSQIVAAAAGSHTNRAPE